MTFAQWEPVSATPEKRVYRNGDVELTATQRPDGHWKLSLPGDPAVVGVNDAYSVLEAYGAAMAELLQRSKPEPEPEPALTLLTEEHRDREWLRLHPHGEAYSHYRYRGGSWWHRRLAEGKFACFHAAYPGYMGHGDTFVEYVPKTVEALDDSHRDRTWKSSQADLVFFWGKNNFDDSNNWKWKRASAASGAIDCGGVIDSYNREFGPFTEYWD